MHHSIRAKSTNHVLVQVVIQSVCLYFHPVYCPNLIEPNTGSIEVTGLTAGSNATYTCEFPFELLDNATDVRTCQPDGNWSQPKPQCIGMLS